MRGEGQSTGSHGSAQAPARAADVATLEINGETLLYHRRTGAVHRLDPVGSIVWRFLDGGTTLDELVADLAAGFGADPAVVRGDVTDLLERLARGFLLADGPTPEPHPEPRPITNPPSP